MSGRLFALLAALLGAAALFAGASGGQNAGAPGPRMPDAGSPEERVQALEARVAELEAELASARERCAGEIADLVKRLDASQRRRSEREYAWFQYNQALVELRLSERVPPFELDPDYEPKTVEPAASAPSPAEELARSLAERAHAIEVSMRHFLLIEEIRGLDILELGALSTGGIGPAVFRLLDDRGRLSGGLSAERLRLEASRSGHTVTLVLENGFESRGGERIPFEGGARRIVLPFVDPEPWIASFPELFPAHQARAPIDDGRHDRGRLQQELNRLLREAGEDGYLRASRIEGVLGGALQLVQLEVYDEQGKLERRLFADRLWILAEAAGVELLLQDGVFVRAGTRTPFVDGTYRVFLPRADQAAWRAAGLLDLAPAAGEDGPEEAPLR
jgi:hypothetical protein